MNEHTTFAPDDWRARSAMFTGRGLPAQAGPIAAARTLAADELGASVGQLATAWTLANPAVHVAIVGARSPKHIEEAVAAAELPLSEGDLERIDRIVADSVPIAGPFP